MHICICVMPFRTEMVNMEMSLDENHFRLVWDPVELEKYSLPKNLKRPKKNEKSVCLYVCVCFSTHRPIFYNKRLFNTCVTPGTAQLKSNTLQESITCWVY